MTEDQIKHMVQRFLFWKLPQDFHPDAGISFEPEFNKEWNARQGKPPQLHEPVGTNLFSGDQATAMVRFMVEEMQTVWQPMTTLPDSDDLVWLCRWPDSISGPRPSFQGDVDDFDLWAPCLSPSLPIQTV